LSGKYGGATWGTFFLAFDDLFASTDPGNLAFFGGGSTTLHTTDKKMIACASFVLEDEDDGDDDEDEEGDKGEDGEDGDDEGDDDEDDDDDEGDDDGGV
jgi:hypothetical protein